MEQMWQEMIRETAGRSGVSPEEAEALLTAFFDAVTQGMQTDQMVMLRPDVGYFEILPPERPRGGPLVRFQKSGQLRTRLRQAAEQTAANGPKETGN